MKPNECVSIAVVRLSLTLCLKPQCLVGKHPQLDLEQARFEGIPGPGSKDYLHR